MTSDKREIKIRLAQIDAPEKSQAFGQRSKQSLSDLVFGKEVRIVREDTDRYGRMVAKVYVGGIDVNAEQVRNGMAWVYTKYATDRSFFDIEKEAKTNRRGLWSDLNPTPPWEYRHKDEPKSVGKKEYRNFQSLPDPTKSVESTTIIDTPQIKDSSCGNKKRCGEMSSCSEAMFYLKECGIVSLDRDRDGIPCESLCK